MNKVVQLEDFQASNFVNRHQAVRLNRTFKLKLQKFIPKQNTPSDLRQLVCGLYRIHCGRSHNSKHYSDMKNQDNAYKLLQAKDLGNIKNHVINDQAAILILNDVGFIQNCNQSSGYILGWQAENLLSQHVSTVFPELAKKSLLKNKQISSNLRFLSRIGHLFDAVAEFGDHFKCELIFNYKKYDGTDYLQVIAHPIESTVHLL